MTNEEAILWMHNFQDNVVKCCNDTHKKGLALNATINAIEALEKAEKYKWHNLRKNPDDLPDMLKNVLIESYCYKEQIVAYRLPERWASYGNDGKCKNIAEFDELGHIDNDDVIAWREIEPFEEEVE